MIGPGLIAVNEEMSAIRNPEVEAESHPPLMVYLVLDEYMGLAGFPPQLAGSEVVIRSIENTFLQYGFTLYSSAFSHYAWTTQSIPSALDLELLPRESETRSAAQYRLFSHFESAGWALSVYYPKRLDWGEGSFRLPFHTDRQVAYDPVALGASRKLRMPLMDRLSLLSSAYVGNSRWISLVMKNLYPASTEAGSLSFWQPLSLEVMDLLLKDILGAKGKTLFFAHLLAPHFDYVYQEDGNAWPLATLVQGARVWEGPPSVASYEAQHQRYAAQVLQLNNRLDEFFRQLEAAGVLGSATIVVHGDHGSRFAGLPEKGAPFRQLLENFSTLLAVKKPGAAEGRVDRRKGSLLGFLKAELYPQTGWICHELMPPIGHHATALTSLRSPS